MNVCIQRDLKGHSFLANLRSIALHLHHIGLAFPSKGTLGHHHVHSFVSSLNKGHCPFRVLYHNLTQLLISLGYGIILPHIQKKIPLFNRESPNRKAAVWETEILPSCYRTASTVGRLFIFRKHRWVQKEIWQLALTYQDPSKLSTHRSSDSALGSWHRMFPLRYLFSHTDIGGVLTAFEITQWLRQASSTLRKWRQKQSQQYIGDSLFKNWAQCQQGGLIPMLPSKFCLPALSIQGMLYRSPESVSTENEAQWSVCRMKALIFTVLG